jgi:protein-disulfide isomerase
VPLICWKRVVPLIAAVAFTGLACTKNPEVAADKGPASARPSPATPPAAPPPAPPAGGAASLAGIPGMDFSALPPAAQAELATIFSDEFCYCGCPHTLGACLRQHTDCRHAKRMARLAARSVSAGVSAAEVIVGLSSYYGTFREARANLKVDPRMCKGPENAPVTVAEFADFECPSCGHASPLLKDFAQKGGDKVRLCFMPFPLPSHPNALPAAQAALWARDQGKFWEMHDALFGQQQNLAPAALPALADKIGLSGAKLQEVLKVGTYLNEVEAFRTQGRGANISGTPSVFFNGRPYPGALTLDPELLAHSLEDELEWRANNNAWAAD